MRSVAATRYVMPLREGGSLPAIVEADDSGLYVVKFRAAGHGVKALIAELVTGELAREASDIVAFDAFATNVDRTARNPNLLCWHGRLWLIDHGSSLYFHHAWDAADAVTPFAAIRDHVLLPWADDLRAAGGRLAAALDRDAVRRALDELPDEWLVGEPRYATAAVHRDAYAQYFERRLEATTAFIEEAERARETLV